MAEPAGATSDPRLAAVAVAVLIGLFGVLVFLVTRMTGGEEEAAKPAEKEKKKRGALDRMQKGAAKAAARAAAADVGDEEDEEEEDDGDGGRDGRQNEKKDQKKQEKKAAQQAQRQVQQEKDMAKSHRETKYATKQAEKEAERERKEEEERKAREEKEKQEQEEFDKWKNMFAVDAEGEAEASGADAGAVERFIDYVKIRKVVQLEDLAAEFRMKTSAAINRLEELEKLGRLSGIFDDRGKFVYITSEEMMGVADWLKKKGRINRADLVAACNRIIRLNPTDEDKAKLQQEAKKAAAEIEEDAEEAGAAVAACADEPAAS